MLWFADRVYDCFGVVDMFFGVDYCDLPLVLWGCLWWFGVLLRFDLLVVLGQAVLGFCSCYEVVLCSVVIVVVVYVVWVLGLAAVWYLVWLPLGLRCLLLLLGLRLICLSVSGLSLLGDLLLVCTIWLWCWAFAVVGCGCW